MLQHRRKLLPLCIASLISGHAAAVGLGDIQLQSPLGSPLQALVPLSELGDISADQLKVKIGSEADYRAMGVEFSYQHTQLKIEPVVRDGRGYVRITTRDPVAEPYLNFVLNVHWPRGQVAREYTVLLDPPDVSAPAAAASAAMTMAEQNMIAASAPAIRPAAPRSSRPVAAAPAPVREAPDADGTYRTQRGDSLWRLAERVRPAEVSRADMMTALFAANPDAFINGNPGLLKEAVAISMPSADQIAAAAGAALPQTPAAAVASRAAAAAAVEPAAESVGAPAVTAAAAAAAPSASLAAENASLRGEVAQLTGNVAALNTNLAQSEQRLRQLESQLDGLMRQFQQHNGAAAGLAAAGPAAAAPESLINSVNAAELVPGAKAHTPWWVHLLYWLGIGGAVAWAAREHFAPRRRLATAGYDIEARPERAAAVPLPSPSASSWATPVEQNFWQEGDELPLDLVSPAPAASRNVAADDPVDAAISAGVFVAFGRFDEAENLLQEALQLAPGRADLKLQLLDVYLQADNRPAFEQLAETIELEHGQADVLAELAVLRNNYQSGH